MGELPFTELLRLVAEGKRMGLINAVVDDYEAAAALAEMRRMMEPEHAGSAYIIQFPSGKVAAGCLGDRCKGKTWTDLRKMWDIVDPNAINESDIKVSPKSESSPLLSQLNSFIEPPIAGPGCFYGPIGRICADLEAHTEPTPIAILMSALSYFGNACGRRLFTRLDEPHFPKLYVALVGPTGSGRKGTADGQAQRIMAAIDPVLTMNWHSGLSTGEGMLKMLDESKVGLDPQPFVFIERELAAVFRRAARQGNTLNTFVRDAWDDKPLANSSIANPIRIENHHVSILAHVTPAELKKLLSGVDVANGFSNRFLWCYCTRESRKPNAAGFQAARYPREIEYLQESLAVIKRVVKDADGPVEVPFSQEASAAWWDHYYPELDIDSMDDTELVLMTNRQPQQVTRIALIFALADRARAIDVKHLEAGRLIIDYVHESLDFILSRRWFGEHNKASDPVAMADKAMKALASGALSRRHILRQVFKRNRTVAEVNDARDLLISQGLIRVDEEGKSETWYPLQV